MKKKLSLLLLTGLTFSMFNTAFAANYSFPKATLDANGSFKMSGETDLPDGRYTIYLHDRSDPNFGLPLEVLIVEDGKVDYTEFFGKNNVNRDLEVTYTDKTGDTTIIYPPETTEESESESEPDTSESESEPGTSESESESEPGTSESESESESEPGTSQPETSDPETPGRPTNPDTPSGGSSSDDDSSSGSGSGSGGGSSGTTTNPNPIKYKGSTEKQTPTQITTPNTGWTSTSGSQMVFFDVQTTDWFANAVNYVTQNGMMVGSNGKFSPNDRLTRGMMAQILYNIEGTPATGTANFPDVNSSDWFANAVAWVNASGYMTGYANGRFGPNDPITREQLAAILYRYSGAKGYTTAATAELSGFADGGATSSWAQTSMRWAVTTGLLSGKTGNRLDPTGTATRAEVAQILMNFGTKIAQ